MMPKQLEVEQIRDLLKPGMTVWVAGGTNEPLSLVDALRAEPAACAGVTFLQSTVPGLNHTDYSALHKDASMTVFMLTGDLRESHQAGRVNFIPKQLRAVHDYFEQEVDIDIAVTQVAPTTQADAFSHGLNADFMLAALARAKCVIAEVNAAHPAPIGGTNIASSRFDYVYHTDRPVPNFPTTPLNAESIAIGKLVEELVPDGACIQNGIGTIPAAILEALQDKNDLGLHSGILDDGIMKLARSGVINGRYKAIDKGRMVAAISMGTDELYQWSTQCEDVLFRPVSYTHNAAVIGQIDNFISINSALEIDLFGQVNAEMIGGRQLSGTGGSVDFMRGASASKGGRSIVALTATANRGKISRIVPKLEAHTTATALRTDIDYVVTEFGVAHLRNLPARARGDALIAIAAPEFRSVLSDEWEQMKPLL
ncbi:MAG: 4-hydroxybutyrate CoA-transferase [Gammaproteobacteria bacterium]|nr:4-hydroxybutyrate CoA-transferase [Gammaproteobacteria bacterium]